MGVWAYSKNLPIISYENGAVLDGRRRDGVYAPRANAEHGQGLMPVPSPEWTGHSLVGSVPG